MTERGRCIEVRGPSERRPHRVWALTVFAAVFAWPVFASADGFEPPAPVPQLTNRTTKDVLTALGTPADIGQGAVADEACNGKCDEVWSYGDRRMQECPRGGAVIGFRRGRVVRVQIVYRGCIHTAPERFPFLAVAIAVPKTQLELAPEGPIKIRADETDYWSRNLQWSKAGVRTTVLVVSPPTRSYEGGMLIPRKATLAEYRLVSVSQLVESVFPPSGDQANNSGTSNASSPEGSKAAPGRMVQCGTRAWKRFAESVARYCRNEDMKRRYPEHMQAFCSAAAPSMKTCSFDGVRLPMIDLDAPTANPLFWLEFHGKRGPGWRITFKKDGTDDVFSAEDLPEAPSDEGD